MTRRPVHAPGVERVDGALFQTSLCDGQRAIYRDILTATRRTTTPGTLFYSVDSGRVTCRLCVEKMGARLDSKRELKRAVEKIRDRIYHARRELAALKSSANS